MFQLTILLEFQAGIFISTPNIKSMPLYLTFERRQVLKYYLNFINTDTEYNHLATLGPLGVGKTVTLMLLYMYLKQINSPVLYYNMAFVIQPDILFDSYLEILRMVYHHYQDEEVKKEKLAKTLMILD